MEFPGSIVPVKNMVRMRGSYSLPLLTDSKCDDIDLARETIHQILSKLSFTDALSQAVDTKSSCSTSTPRSGTGEEGLIEVRWAVNGAHICYLPAEQHLNVLQVKEHLAEYTGVPVEEQRILLEEEELPLNAALPGPGSALTLMRDEGDPHATDLSFFHIPVDFGALPPGQFALAESVAEGIHGIIYRCHWRRVGEAPCTVAVQKIRSQVFPQLEGAENNERAAHFEPWLRTGPTEDPLNEIGILTYLAQQPDMSPHLLRMHSVFNHGEHTWLVTEFADGGELFNVAATRLVPETELRRYANQCLLGLQYLHSHYIGHRDISLENLLLKDDVVKLMDFGMSVRSHSIHGVPLRFFRSVGKDQYRAPEAYVPRERRIRAAAPRPMPRSRVALVESPRRALCEVRFPLEAVPGQACRAEVWGYCAQPADIFSLGACFFILAWQCPIFRNALLSDPLFAWVHRHGDNGLALLLDHWQKEHLSPGGMAFLSKMLRSDPTQRPSARECLGSDWLQGGD